MKNEEINFSAIEKKWQKKLEEKKAFQVKENSSKKKYYVLEMFPYPSSSGLHMGHAFNYVIGDIQARFRRMNGFNVLYPMGYDSFGLPAENAAIKEKLHPKKFTENAIKNFIRQQKSLGLSYDWSRIVMTHSPEYYKWNQFLFLKFCENGLVYRKKAPVNYCEKCQTVLANEQVHNGKCWRHTDTDIETRQLEQWFIRITKYAEELLRDIGKIEWPERIKIMQENWIGRSQGTEILFEIAKNPPDFGAMKSGTQDFVGKGEKWSIFTTRPDTIFGVTFMVISSQHSRLFELVNEKQKKEVEKFLKKIKSTSEKDLEKLEKEGVFTGSYAINPLTNEKIPIYAGNFVVADYGSGMVMAVPGHDQRDFEFAKKYGIGIKQVIEGKITTEKAYTGEGVLINSKQFNGINSKKAIEEITDYLEKKKLGKKCVQYKLRDWLISRQRYWGTPIPVVYCDKCGIVPVPEKELPVKLPEKVKFGKGNPLGTNKKFVETKCPKCNGKARRETDTMDTFFDSSWYFLRYIDPKNNKKPFDEKKINYWMPVDQYIGGAEHATMHLIYARFFTKALRDLKIIGKIDEPFIRLFNQGMLHKDGFVMSKSRGNVVLPEEVSKKYGIDTARLFLMSVASPDKDTEWSDFGIDGTLKFMKKLFNYVDRVKINKSSNKIESKINKAIKEISEDIENFRYNLAVIKLRILLDYFEREKEISKKDLESFLKLFSPFCPHITEELWNKIGNKNFISLEKWPKCDERKINEKFELAEKDVEKTVSDILNLINILKEKQGRDSEKVYVYVLPQEKEFYDRDEISKRVGKYVIIYAVNERDKYDPKKWAEKAKPGRPAIYVE